MPTSAQHMERALNLHKPIVERSASQPPTLSHGSRRPQRVPPAIFVCLVMAVVLITAARSFLGLGVQPPMASLGAMICQGQDYLATAWWVVATPASLIV